MKNLANSHNMARHAMDIDRTRTNLTRQAISLIFRCFEEIGITWSTRSCSTCLYVQSDPLNNINLIVLRSIHST